MKFFAKAALPLFFVLAALSSQARADITLTITQNVALGGTNWAFSNGSGTIGSSASPYFLVGANPVATKFMSTSNFHDGSLSVVAGVNTFNLVNIFAYNYGNLSGTDGNINQGLDFQGSGSWAGKSISGFNGLVLHANSHAFSNFNPGTYILPSYYSGYNTNLGKFTLNVRAVAADVPEPGSLALLGLGLVSAGMVRRRKVKAA